MDFVHFVFTYFGLTAFLVFVLLFGESPAFAGTPVSFCRWLLTEAWMVALEWVVHKACGDRGLRMLDRATECCCESSNPTLQIAYLLIYLFGYGLYWQYVFKLLPNPYAAEYHLYTGTAAVCLTLSLFLKASMSDPGRLTAANAALYAAAYPPDGLLFPPKQCSTCRLSRPGRSKHCNACHGCIVRFDHHCGWINNCVGLHNMRDFLAFLLANFVVCVYGLLLTVAVMAGELQRRGFFDVYVYDPKLRDRVPLYQRPARFAEWVLVYYPIPVAVGMFLCVAGGLMLSFFMYQGYLISEGRTTYEILKGNQLMKDLAALAATQQEAAEQEHQQRTNSEQKGRESQRESGSQQLEFSSRADGIGSSTAAAAAGAAAGTTTKGTKHISIGWLARLWSRGQQRRRHTQVLQPLVNYYDRGFWTNWHEVLFPDAFLQQYRQRLQPSPADGVPSHLQSGANIKED